MAYKKKSLVLMKENTRQHLQEIVKLILWL